jgi:hypothetical protein
MTNKMTFSQGENGYFMSSIHIYMVIDERWCPADPVAESPTVLQSNLQQSTMDGEGGRAAKASAERRGSSGLGGARAPNNKNLGWLKGGSPAVGGKPQY